jgi:YVTN family beta-propeller protein
LESNGRRPPFQRSTKLSPRAVGLAVAGVAAASVLAGVLYTAFGPGGGEVSVAPNSVAAFNPATDQLTADLAVGVRPQGVAVGEGSVWVANTDDRTVSRLDPSALELVRTIPVGVYPSDVAAGPLGVWVVSGPSGRLLRIDRKGAIALGYTCGKSASVTLGAGSLWASCDVAPGAFRAHPGTRSATAFLSAERRSFSDALFGLGALWLADRTRGEVVEIDPATNRPVRRVRVGRRPVALAAGARSIWVANSGNGTVSRIGPGTVVTIKVGREPVAVAFAGNALWVANAGDRTLSRVDPRTNAVVATVKLSNTPVGLALGDARLWVAIQPH